MQTETVNTKRLKLIKVDEKVLEYVFTKMSGAEQMLFMGCKTANELAEWQRKYDGGLTTFNRKMNFFFLLHKETNENIGWCGYHTWYIDHHRAEIGYGINEDFQNQGLMTEATKAILDYGFNTMKLRRVEAFVGEENIPSLRLMQIFGFTKEGMARKHYNIDGINLDSLMFGLLLEEHRF
jgi:ribosomal-protein-alanine N-acetyltransferase